MACKLPTSAGAKAFVGVLPVQRAASGLPSLRGQELHTHLMTSPRCTRRLFRTTLFIRIFSSEHVSSESTMHTASRLFFPFSNTVSPRNNCSSSILGWDKDTTLLSSLMASSTINRLGRFFCLRMAVDKSSPFELEREKEVSSKINSSNVPTSL